MFLKTKLLKIEKFIINIKEKNIKWLNHYYQELF
jgi:hypothetical protein